METTQNNKSVLGRGIGSLLPENNKRGYFYAQISELYPNHAQPRKHFDEVKLKELAQSIKEKGVLQPIIVKKTDKGYVIIAGERRWRASQIAGKKEVPVIVKELSDNEILETALIENVQREDLNPIEEAESYQRLILDLGLTQEEISRRVGKDRTTIANALRLLKLSKEVREQVALGALSQGHARCLISVEDKKLQNELLEDIVKKGYSVRQVEALVKKLKGGKSADNAGQSAKDMAANEIEHYDALAQELRKVFDARVEVRPQASGKGQIIVPYLNRDDFDRIVGKIRSINGTT
jgi:ParB family chromosome partitioning protein